MRGGVRGDVRLRGGMARRYRELTGATTQEVPGSADVLAGRGRATRSPVRCGTGVDRLGELVAEMVRVLALPVIVIGGGLVRAGEDLMVPLDAAVRSYLTIHQAPGSCRHSWARPQARTVRRPSPGTRSRPSVRRPCEWHPAGSCPVHHPNPAWDVTYGVDRLDPGSRCGSGPSQPARAARASTSPESCVRWAVTRSRSRPRAVSSPRPSRPTSRARASPRRSCPSRARCGRRSRSYLSTRGPTTAVTPRSSTNRGGAHRAGVGPAGPDRGRARRGPPGRHDLRVAAAGHHAGPVHRAGGLAARGGCPVHVDVSGPGLLWAAEAGADLIKPNRAELAEATGTHDLTEGVAALHRLGRAPSS
ncbi:hypothetical protein NKG05_04095 [Oerskovia sp. M15]